MGCFAGGAAALGEAKRTQKDIMWENGGPGQYLQSWREHWDLKNAEWKTDRVPEIMDGKNIADFVHPDIMEKLEALERHAATLQGQAERKKNSRNCRLTGQRVEKRKTRAMADIFRNVRTASGWRCGAAGLRRHAPPVGRGSFWGSQLETGTAWGVFVTGNCVLSKCGLRARARVRDQLRIPAQGDQKV